MSELALQLIEENKRKYAAGEDASFLDLGNCGLEQLPEELFECVWLKALNLGYGYYSDDRRFVETENRNRRNELDYSGLSGLEHLSGLKELYLGKTKVNDLRPLSGLTGLQTLYLGFTKVTDLKPLSNLTGLQTLNLNGTRLNDLKPLSGLTSLRTLYLGSTEIRNLEPLAGLTGLQTLNLEGTQVSDLKPLSGLTGLQRLDLRGTQVSDLMPLSRLIGLQALDLDRTQVSDLKLLSGLTGLQELHFGGTPISDLQPLSGLAGLQELSLNGTPVRDLRPLSNLSLLQKLFLRSTPVSDLQPLSGMRGLQILDLNCTEVTDLHPLSCAICLQALFLYETQIRDLEPLSGLTGLEILDLTGTQVDNLLPLAGLTRLQTLCLNDTQVSDLRPLSSLTRLQELYLEYTRISDVQPLTSLDKLQDLALKGNSIRKLSKSIFQLPLDIVLGGSGKRGLQLTNNPIESPPLEILKQGRSSVLAWFEANKKKLNEIKIILIGDPKAGKTSLLRRLKDNTFDANEVQTDGINIEHIAFGACPVFQKQTSLHKITGHFWDFGGQEIMNATHQFFLTNRCVYVLVLDARKDADVSGQIRHWVKRIKATGGGSPIIVVVNQIDVNRGFGFSNEYELKRDFPQIKYLVKASCLTGEGIDFIREKLAELIPQSELFQTEIDERWIGIKEQLQEETGKRSFVDEERFNEICREHGLSEKQGRKNAITFLHDLGLVLHFEALNLSEYYVLDPYWITYGVYQIVTSAYAAKQKGIVGMDMLDYIVNEEVDKKEIYRPAQYRKIQYTGFQLRFLADILNQFKLSFYLPDRTGFIIPDLLDTDEPRDITVAIRANAESIRFVYEYKYLPKSIMPNIMVEVSGMLAPVWRTGCVLLSNGCTAMISDYQNQIAITVTGEHKAKREFMAVIRHLIDTINRKLQDQPQMLVPLPGQEGFFDYEELLEREKDGERYCVVYRPEKKRYEISILLEGLPTLEEVEVVRLKPAQEVSADLHSFVLQSLKQVKKVFISYSHHDRKHREDAEEFLVNLERDQSIVIWHDKMIQAGDKWDDKIREKLEQSDFIVLLVSQQFIGSDYVNGVEMPAAIGVAIEKKAIVVPFLLKTCDWRHWKVIPKVMEESEINRQQEAMGQYQFIPVDKNQKLKPLFKWLDKGDAWMQLVNFIRSKV